MSQSSVDSSVGEVDIRVPRSVKVAKYTLNGGKTVNGLQVFASGATIILDGPPLLAGDLILNVVTDTIELFGDADGGNDTQLTIRFNDGTTQTDIQAAGSIGSAPFSTVRNDLMVQDFATEGDWLKLTLTTRVEVVVQAAVDITAGIMDVYVMYVSPRG